MASDATDSTDDIYRRRLVTKIQQSSRIVGFTGAGISTESGIPDYRSQGGLWDRYQPVYFQDFLQSETSRREYWQRHADIWPTIRDAKPNSGHQLLQKLHEKGKLLGIITQNIDGLHEKSGIPPDIMANLHGTSLYTSCLSCYKRWDSQIIFENLSDIPLCDSCGGLLKPETVSFGQSLRQEDLERARSMASACDMMIIMGSTLLVYPASEFPYVAKANGACIVLVTLSETPMDDEVDFHYRVSIGDFAQHLMARLGRSR